jgi:hypothetical protein
MGFWLWWHPTGETLVESTLFPRHFNENMLNQRGKDAEFKSVPSGAALFGFILMDLLVVVSGTVRLGCWEGCYGDWLRSLLPM